MFCQCFIRLLWTRLDTLLFSNVLTECQGIHLVIIYDPKTYAIWPYFVIYGAPYQTSEKKTVRRLADLSPVTQNVKS